MAPLIEMSGVVESVAKPSVAKAAASSAWALPGGLDLTKVGFVPKSQEFLS